MIERDLLPDCVISLEDDSTAKDYLLQRFAQLHNLPDPTAPKQAEAGQEELEESKEQVNYSHLYILALQKLFILLLIIECGVHNYDIANNYHGEANIIFHVCLYVCLIS